jgi:tetratricopeptide (TPR) repeat protein
MSTAIARRMRLLSGIEAPRIVVTQRRDADARVIVITGAADTVYVASLESGHTAHGLSRVVWQSVAALVRDAVPVDSPPRHVRDAFRQGQFVLESHDDGRLETALDLFRSVIAQAPGFAPAHAAIAHAHLMRGEYPPARRAAQHALALDRHDAAAHMTLANVSLYADWDRRASREHHRTVLRRFPGWSTAHVSYAYLLSGEGRHDEALAHARLALELDPVSPIVHGDLGLLYLLAGRFENAIVHCRRTLELDPQQWFSRACLVDALLAAGDSADAQNESVHLMRVFSASAKDIATVRDGAPQSAFEAYWRWTLTWALPRGNRWYPYFAARAYVGVSEFNTAVTTLVRAADEHAETVATRDDGGRRVIGTAMFPALRVDPRFAPLHDDIRFAQLVARIAGG